MAVYAHQNQAAVERAASLQTIIFIEEFQLIDKDIVMTDAMMDDWIKRNVDQENVDDLLEGLQGKGSDEFTVTDDPDTDSTHVIYNEEPLDGIVLPTDGDLNRFRSRLEKLRISESDAGYLHGTNNPKQ